MSAPMRSALELLYVVGPVAALSLALLGLHAWRLVLFLWPGSIRLSPIAPLAGDQGPLPPELVPWGTLLLRMGLRPLGVRAEVPRFGRPATCYEFVNDDGTAWATLYLGARRRPRLYFLSRVWEDRQPVLMLTATSHRPGARSTPAYRPGAFETFTPERLYAAHLRRLTGTRPRESHDGDGRVAAAREWYGGPGVPETRAQTLHGLLWSLFAVFMFAAVLWARR